MAANTDLYKKVSRRWVGQIGSGGVADASTATIPLSSATNLPTDTAVVCTIDRVDANGTATASLEETVIGVIISGSNNLTTCTRGVEGTAQAHSAGAVVEVLITAKGWNDLCDAMLTEHSQTGTHGNISLCNVTASGVSTLSNITSCSVVASRAVSASTVSASDIVASRNMTASMIGAIGTSKSIGFSTGIYQTAQAYVPSGAGTSTLNLALGNEHVVTMPAATQTLAISNGTVGQKFIVSINNVTSQGALTWFSTIRWADGSAPTLTGTNGKRDTFGFVMTGSNTYDGFIIGQNI